MNLSRAYTLAYNEELSVGRVQTPTLAMLVERELAIRAFVPEDYLEVVATFSPAAAGATLPGHLVPAGATEDASDAPAAGRRRGRRASSSARASGQARIESIDAETQRMPPPLLYDLTELQRHANRLYGFSAQKTLDLAQALYERHKLISYPRTDSRHLSADVARTLPRIVRAIAAPYARAARAGHRGAPARPALRRRFQGHRPPRHHPHRHVARAGLALARREARSTT